MCWGKPATIGATTSPTGASPRASGLPPRVRSDLQDGSLVQLLMDFGTDSMPIHAIYPSRRLLPKRVVAAIDAIAAALSRSDFPISK
jgi:DNA-binding transcriptional LysR family regulator